MTELHECRLRNYGSGGDGRGEAHGSDQHQISRPCFKQYMLSGALDRSLEFRELSN